MTTLVLRLFKHSTCSTHGGRWNHTGVGAAWGKAIRLIEVWASRARTRRELAMLDERMLRDAGITRAQARYEASKPFWRP